MLPLLVATVVLFCSACAALKTELGVGVQPTNNPPLAVQLNTAAPVVAAVVPTPWGTLLSAVLNLMATGAAAFATFHARAAARTSALAKAVEITPAALT